MFEWILESVLNKVLGQFIQDLDKNALSVSVWSGNISLKNVRLKNDLFQQFKLPLQMVFGQIGNLTITVPWKAIGSKPVDVVVENVLATVSPQTDSSTW